MVLLTQLLLLLLLLGRRRLPRWMLLSEERALQLLLQLCTGDMGVEDVHDLYLFFISHLNLFVKL